MTFHILGIIIIPSDEVIFFRGLGQPPSSMISLRFLCKWKRESPMFVTFYPQELPSTPTSLLRGGSVLWMRGSDCEQRSLWNVRCCLILGWEVETASNIYIYIHWILILPSKSLIWMCIPTGWWFGTFFVFPYIGNNHPN